MFSKKSKQRSMVEKEQDPKYPLVNGQRYLEVLNGIEAKLQPKLYLEIGSRTGKSLLPRKCSFIAIDPVFKLGSADFSTQGDMFFCRKTSDSFFESNFLQNNNLVPDWAFIDGLHLFENALKDFMNCEKSMSKDGLICLHDVVPFNGEMTTRDENYLTQGTGWTGDVWKVVPILKRYRPDLKIDVVNSHRTGLCAVSNLNPDNRVLDENFADILEEFVPIDLAKEGPEYYFKGLDLIDPQLFLEAL